MSKVIRVAVAGLWLSAALAAQSGVSFDRILHREPADWLTYSGSLDGRRYSPIRQITSANVSRLRIAWVWQSQSLARFQASPLAVDGRLYTVQSPNDVVALDAATGRLLWTYRYSPREGVRASGGGGRPNRGLAIAGDTLFLGTLDAHLLAINARTGELRWNVAVADALDPQCQVPAVGRVCYVITLAPLIVRDKVLVGVGGGDTEAAGLGIRGFVAAYAADTGKQVWRFSTIPAPGEPGSETWSGDAWKTGGAGVWNTGTYDPDLNLTYWGTGNPAPPAAFQKELATTRPGDNLFSDSLVALDADTGALKWHFQFTPHDDQDWDSAHVPVLADVSWRGTPRKVVLLANKNGFFYVLDRATGEFVNGTPFVQVNWATALDAHGRPVRLEPVSGTQSVVFPGVATNWYPPSYSPRTGLFYVPAWERGTRNGILQRGEGYGALRALDPGTGRTQWEFRLDGGLFASGALTTGADLLFTGVEGDFFADAAASRAVNGLFYALDARTGRALWKVPLGGAVTGPPITYAVAGKQYVAVNAGSALFAFALPD